MCLGSRRFCKQHASIPIKNPEVSDWLKSIRIDKHGTGPLPPALPVPPAQRPNSVGMKECPPSLGITAPTIVIESPDNMRIGFDANGIKDSLDTTLLHTPIEEVDDEAKKFKSVICNIQEIEDDPGEESIDAHPMSVNNPAESPATDIVEGKSVVEAIEETAGSDYRITAVAGNLDTGSDNLTTHVGGGGGEEGEQGKPESATFSGFSGDFTRDDGSESSENSEGGAATLEPSDQQVECGTEVEDNETEPIAAEPVEIGVRERVDIASLDPGPTFNFSDVGFVEMLDPALFHDMYTGPIWSGGLVTRNPGILLERSGDYQRYGLQPPEDCIKDEEDTPELTYTADGRVITPELVERYDRLREWKTRNESQSYPAPQSTPNFGGGGKKLNRSEGGRYYENGSGRGYHMPATLASESRWNRLSSTSMSATNPSHCRPSDRYRAPRSSQLGSSSSSTSTKWSRGRVPISNLPRVFGLER